MEINHLYDCFWEHVRSEKCEYYGEFFYNYTLKWFFPSWELIREKLATLNNSSSSSSKIYSQWISSLFQMLRIFTFVYVILCSLMPRTVGIYIIFCRIKSKILLDPGKDQPARGPPVS
jgi:hypothetical protein